MFERERGGPTSRALSRPTHALRVLAVGAVLTVVAILVAGFGVFPQGPLRRPAEGRLRTEFGDGSRLGGLRVVPFLLKAELHDLRLEGSGYALTVPEARIALAPRVLRGALELRRLEVDSPVLELTSDPGDDTPDETPVALPPVEIEAVAIRDATVSWVNPEVGEGRLSGISAEGAIGSGSLAVRAPRGVWRGETTLELGPARARLSVSRELDVVLDSSEVRLGASVLRGHGPLTRRGAVVLGLDVEADLDLSDGGDLAGQPELAGALGVTGRLEGPANSLRGDLQARGAAAWG